MTAPASRMWHADEKPAGPAPIVLVSSRDEHAVPHVRNAVKLAELGRAHGWSVRERYARARLDQVEVESVSVRLHRDDMFAIGLWWNRSTDGAWRFETGLYGFLVVQFRDLCARVTR